MFCGNKSKLIYYYPFGMMQPERKFNAGNYRFGFNKGSEKDDGISGIGNNYTTFFREFNTRIARWITVDPKPNAFESSYSSMGNNPILQNDPVGDVVAGDKKGMGLYNKGKQIVSVNIQSLTTKINNIQNKNGDPLSKAQKAKIEKLQSRLDAYKQANNEFAEMEKSEYLFNINTNGMTSIPDQVGLTSSGGLRVINISIYNNSIGTVFHELKHGYQFLEGKIAFDIKSGTGVAGLVDRSDELEASNREILILSGINNYYSSEASLISDIPRYSALPSGQHTIYNTKFSDIDKNYTGNEMFLEYLRSKYVENSAYNYVNYHRDIMRKAYEEGK